VHEGNAINFDFGKFNQFSIKSKWQNFLQSIIKVANQQTSHTYIIPSSYGAHLSNQKQALNF
jgi:hypothetical protein